MDWKRYSEGRGRPSRGEVVIRCAPADRDHPWVRRRRAQYEAAGKRTVVAPARDRR